MSEICSRLTRCRARRSDTELQADNERIRIDHRGTARSVQSHVILTSSAMISRCRWSKCAESLRVESSAKSTGQHVGKKEKKVIKKAFVVFAEEWERGVEVSTPLTHLNEKAQKSCSVPEDDLRKKITGDLKQLVGTPYQSFYNK